MVVLLVDFDGRASARVCTCLAPLCPDMQTASSAQAAMNAAQALNPEVMVLVGAPDNGQLRKCLHDAGRLAPLVPLMVVAQHDDALARAGMLDLGADDCLSSPWHQAELAARIKALARRARRASRAHKGSSPATRTIGFGALELDIASAQFSVHESALRLSGAEHAVLEVLIRHAGKLVDVGSLSHGMNAAACPRKAYKDGVKGAHKVAEVVIARLRRKLEIAGMPNSIHNVYGQGYRLDLSQPKPCAPGARTDQV